MGHNGALAVASAEVRLWAVEGSTVGREGHIDVLTGAEDDARVEVGVPTRIEVLKARWDWEGGVLAALLDPEVAARPRLAAIEAHVVIALAVDRVVVGLDDVVLVCGVHRQARHVTD